MTISLTIAVIGSTAGVAIAESIGRLAAFGAGIKVAILLAGLVVAVEGLSSWLERRRNSADGDRRAGTRWARSGIRRRVALSDRAERPSRRPLARPSPPR